MGWEVYVCVVGGDRGHVYVVGGGDVCGLGARVCVC